MGTEQLLYLWGEDTFVLDGNHLAQLQGSSPHSAQSICKPFSITFCHVAVASLRLLASTKIG